MKLCLHASVFLLLLLSAYSPAIAGDGDVNYSAPYITVDPETGELVTVNPGPELKTHPGAGSATSAGNDGGVAADDQTTQASGDRPGSALFLLAALATLGVLSALVLIARGRARMTDA